MGRPTAEIDHGCQLATSYWPASHAAIEIPEIAAPLYLTKGSMPSQASLIDQIDSHLRVILSCQTRDHRKPHSAPPRR